MKLVRGNEALFALCKARWHPSSLTPTTMLEQLSQPASPLPACSIENLLWKLSISAESSSWEEVIIPGEKMPLLWGCMQGSHSAADNLEGNTESLHEHGSASPARKADTTGTGCLQVALSLPSPLYLAQQPLPPCGNISLCKPDGCPWVRADHSPYLWVQPRRSSCRSAAIRWNWTCKSQLRWALTGVFIKAQQASPESPGGRGSALLQSAYTGPSTRCKCEKKVCLFL